MKVGAILTLTWFLMTSFNLDLLEAQARMLTSEEMKQDIQLLRTKLEQHHPNLYLYIDKETLDYIFDVMEQWDQPQSGSEFYAFLSSLSILIYDGHLIFLPSPDAYNNASKVMPLQLQYVNDNLFVRNQYAQQPTIPSGSHIFIINNEAPGALANDLLRSLPSDGANWQYNTWILNQYFAAYYSFTRGHPDTFIIGSSFDGKIRADTLSSMTWDSINYYKNQAPAAKPSKGISFTIEKETNFACLKIPDFHPNILRKKYNQHFTQEIKEAFAQLKKENMSSLILDLRDNQGGRLQYGQLLLSHLVDTSFAMIESYYKRNGKEPGTIKEISGPCLRTKRAHENVFKGQLYVLINGGTFSNSSIVASVLQRNTDAIFIGEESGGNRQIIGGFSKQIILPNSQIRVQLPRRRIVIDSSAPFAGEGVKPDHLVKPSIEELIQLKDPAMEVAVKLIAEQKR
jgi:hypothetical protein